MRVIAFFILLLLIACSGCGKSDQENPGTAGEKAAQNQSLTSPAGMVPETMKSGGGGGGGLSAPRQISLSTEHEAVVVEAIQRKIIRNAEISIELDAPTEAQHKITAVAESLGGFVVTSEFRQQDNRGQSAPTEIVKVIVRVPAAQFNLALEQIRGVGSRVLQEKVMGQDVTEEYIDLEARIRTKKALELQFIEIMKQAKKVTDALEVQSQLADVRTEIEQLEGRRRFLENQSNLSTITITLQMPQPIVTATTSGFGHEIKEAFGDGVDTAVAIVIGLIRFLIVMIPVALFILLPLALVLRFLLRRFRMTRKEPVAES